MANCAIPYAREEARRNLARKYPDFLNSFEFILQDIRLVKATSEIPCPAGLPEKDCPIYLAAHACRCSHLRPRPMPWPWSPAISSPRRWWWRLIVSALPNTAAVRSGLVRSPFRAGSVSVASAAQVAGLPLPRFLEILSSLKIPVAEGDSAELQEDLANARRWFNPSS